MIHGKTRHFANSENPRNFILLAIGSSFCLNHGDGIIKWFFGQEVCSNEHLSLVMENMKSKHEPNYRQAFLALHCLNFFLNTIIMPTMQKIYVCLHIGKLRFPNKDNNSHLICSEIFRLGYPVRSSNFLRFSWLSVILMKPSHILKNIGHHKRRELSILTWRNYQDRFSNIEHQIQEH